jgi:hypothetical protein
MFQRGALWLDKQGRLIAINYQTEQGKRTRAELIEADKEKREGHVYRSQLNCILV